jgi:glycosyltransferase involved in cell wall biosynthesis
VFFSVVIPTYNRQPILEKCLQALEKQDYSDIIQGYEIVLVDDGSTDGTIDWLKEQPANFPHVRYFVQDHKGPAVARNRGITEAKGDFIIFIDSDLVVTAQFLQAHATALISGAEKFGKVFTYGRVVNTCNFANPSSEPYKITDFSAAYFATGNVAIARNYLLEAGLFDSEFSLYGWEDLELGVRLKKLGLKLIKCPAAVGYHWHPPFNLSQLPNMINREIERGKMAILFYEKHPTWDVKMMTQMTWLHYVLWGVLSLGGQLNEKTMARFLQWLIDQNKSQLALELARIFLNWYNVKAIRSMVKSM